MATPFLRPTLTAIVFMLCLPRVLMAEPPAKGDLWQVITKMSMAGMPIEMPAQTAQYCAAKEWTKPPADDNPRQRCTRSDYHMAGGKATWTESCVSPAMTGRGEITRLSADVYTGTIQYSSAQGNMTIKLNGRKIGECDNPR